MAKVTRVRRRPLVLTIVKSLNNYSTLIIIHDYVALFLSLIKFFFIIWNEEAYYYHYDGQHYNQYIPHLKFVCYLHVHPIISLYKHACVLVRQLSARSINTSPAHGLYNNYKLEVTIVIIHPVYTLPLIMVTLENTDHVVNFGDYTRPYMDYYVEDAELRGSVG